MRLETATKGMRGIGLLLPASVLVAGAGYFDPVHQVLELAGIFAFAVLGALVGVRRGFNLTIVVVLAEVTALGGGVVRDLSIGAPPVAFFNLGYILTPLAAAAVVVGLRPQVERAIGPVLALDAIGVSLFCVSGTMKAFAYGQAPLLAALLGVVTAIGGGMLRDLLTGRMPAVLRPGREVYAEPVILGTVMVAVLLHLHLLNPITGTAVAVVALLVRLVSIRYGWQIIGAKG